MLSPRIRLASVYAAQAHGLMPVSESHPCPQLDQGIGEGDDISKRTGRTIAAPLSGLVQRLTTADAKGGRSVMRCCDHSSRRRAAPQFAIIGTYSESHPWQRQPTPAATERWPPTRRVCDRDESSLIHPTNKIRATIQHWKSYTNKSERATTQCEDCERLRTSCFVQSTGGFRRGRRFEIRSGHRRSFPALAPSDRCFAPAGGTRRYHLGTDKGLSRGMCRDGR